ncbi:uncharacterized protein LOC122888254 [Siniperca chuatsi]|uniref:uncharacterized protein LOC122888254 n=1 Tax=Siniperca chuatsi TaxID=119488 RepID=UPI001CE177AB|nr:uncharacterized protein LOC122888254 [Siniperca chuatsi]
MSEMNERMKRKMTAAMALEMLQNLDSDDSDAGDLSEVESDTDLSFVQENTSSSSESDSESIPRKKRRLLSSETRDPGVPFTADVPGLPEPVPALEPTGVLSLPLESSRPEAAVEKGKDGTVWTVLQSTERPRRRQSQNVLSIKRFREIMKILRFDKKETRRVRLQDDKFALVSATWNKFVQNSIACYKHGANITIDEQMFPTKAQCRFIQYMGNKPGKFGIKFWLAADVQDQPGWHPGENEA